MHFCFTVLFLSIVILAWNYYSLEPFTRDHQILNQQSLGHCRALGKVFSLHRTIIPTTGESEEVMEEERILEFKREKRSRKTAVTERLQLQKRATIKKG